MLLGENIPCQGDIIWPDAKLWRKKTSLAEHPTGFYSSYTTMIYQN